MIVIVLTFRDHEGKIIEQIRIEKHQEISTRLLEKSIRKTIKDQIVYMLDNEQCIQNIEIEEFPGALTLTGLGIISK